MTTKKIEISSLVRDIEMTFSSIPLFLLCIWFGLVKMSAMFKQIFKDLERNNKKSKVVIHK